MRRVEHDHSKAVVRVRHIGKVCLHIGFDFKMSPIAEGSFHVSDVLKQYTRVVFVEVEHLATTTSIEDWFFAKRQMRRCFCPLTYRMTVRNIHPFAKFIFPSQLSVEVAAPIIDKNIDNFAIWCIEYRFPLYTWELLDFIKHMHKLSF